MHSLALGLALVSLASADESVRLPVVRDTWFSNVGSEADGNNGGAPQLKIKSHQEMSLIDFDVAPLRGRVIKSAALHLHRSGEAPLLRVTVGTFASEWYEGTGRGYEKQAGASTHNRRRHPDELWAGPGSDLCSVMLGNGGTTWGMADAGPVDAEGFQAIPVASKVVAARTAGVSRGFLVYDDTGSEWRRDGEKFTAIHMPNRYFHSKDQNRMVAPYLTVVLGEVDRDPPEAVLGLSTRSGGKYEGGAVVAWKTPKDRGASGVVGFLAKLDGNDLPRRIIPAAGSSGEQVLMRLEEMEGRSLSIQAVDGAGNVGPASTIDVAIPKRASFALPGRSPVIDAKPGPLPKVGSHPVAILDELDKVQPGTGRLIPEQPKDHLSLNHLWDASRRTVRLHAAKNEFVAFQVLIQGEPESVRATLEFEGAKIPVEIGRYHHVATSAGPLPDPIVPPSAETSPGAKSQSLHVEVYVPHGTSAGERRGKLVLGTETDRLTLDVALTVWDFTLPDRLSFLPEMNCYGLPREERDYYRLAHKHRTFLNRVPYSQRGEVAEGCAPRWDGAKLDWTDWDNRFGPYFDGSAFADLPRKGEPIDAFYLPIHENWPTPIEKAYNGSYWADAAFTPEYRANLVEVSRQFAEHLHGKGWNDTLFEFFLNGKNDFKRNGWSRASSPWILDEPSSFQDFWALRWFGLAFHEGVAKTTGRAKLVYRCDVSRPQWQRDSLDGLLDVDIVGGAFRSYGEIVMNRKRDQGQVVIEYSSANPIEQSNVQPLAWSIDAWTLGSDGVLPWQTLGTADSWKKADALSLFYPPREGVDRGPIPSVRLKAFRRGQQDVEYLTLLSIAEGVPRSALGEAVRRRLNLVGRRSGSGFVAGEDAGLITFSNLSARDLWSLRVQVGEVLSGLKPPPRRSLVEFRTPKRDPAALLRRTTTTQPITVSP